MRRLAPSSRSLTTSSSSSSSPMLSFTTALLVLLLSLSPFLVTGQPSSSGPSGPTITLPPGSVSQESVFFFSDANDGMACLSTDASATIAYAASDGGDIYTWSLPSKPLNVTPSYVAGTGSSGASFVACQARPDGSAVYLLDTRQLALTRYSAATPSTAPVLIATFTNEEVGSLTSLAVDFNASIAYVATRDTDLLYAVNVSLTAQSISSFASNAYTLNSDVSALALSPDARTLYYAEPAPSQGVPGSINALPVSAGVVTSSQSPTIVVQALALIWPVSLLFNSTAGLLYIKDGGPFHGEAEPNEDPDAFQSVFALPFNPAGAVNTSATLPALLRTNTLNLPAGLAFTSDQQSLYFTATASLNRLYLYSRVVAAPPSSSVFSSSARSSSSSAVTAAARSSTSAPAAATSTPAAAATSSPIPTSFPQLPTVGPTASPATSAPTAVTSGQATPTSTPTATPTTAPTAPTAATVAPASSTAATAPPPVGGASTAAPISPGNRAAEMRGVLGVGMAMTAGLVASWLLG